MGGVREMREKGEGEEEEEEKGRGEGWNGIEGGRGG